MKLNYSLVALSMLFSASAIAAPNFSNDEIRLGVLTDMSGPYSSFQGPGSVEAAKLAIEDFGQTVHGVPIKLVSEDHRNSGQRGTSVTKRWTEQDGVDAIFEVGNSALALSVADLASSGDFITVITGSSTQNLEEEHCNPYSIHYAWNSSSLANVASKALLDQGKDKWFFITVDFEFGQTLQKIATEAIEEAGGEVVGSAMHPMEENDYSSYVLQARGSGADVVAIANAGTQLVNTMRAVKQFGLEDDQEVASLLTFITDIDSIGLEDAQGLKYATAFYWDQDDESKAWSERYYEKVGSMPTMNHAAVYSGVLHYLKAVDDAGTDNPEEVSKKMRELPVNDIFAKNGKIREDGLHVHDWHLVEVKSPEESEGKWDYAKVISTVPADEAYQPMSKKCPLVK